MISLTFLLSILGILAFFFIIYLHIKGDIYYKPVWLDPQFYSDLFQTLFNRNYNSLEWSLNSPPKPHTFTSLTLQNGNIFSGLINTVFGTDTSSETGAGTNEIPEDSDSDSDSDNSDWGSASTQDPDFESDSESSDSESDASTITPENYRSKNSEKSSLVEDFADVSQEMQDLFGGDD
jgi:hypothetical protein